jgi:putative ABC transport system substrate-binding protein
LQRGWPTSLARPGGNLTGVSTDAGFEIWNKRFQFLREAAAQLTRVSVLAPRGIWEGRYGPALRDLTRGTAVSLLEIPLEEPVTETAYGRFFEALAQAGADDIAIPLKTRFKGL